MYKAAVRALMRHSIRKLNSGDASLLVKMARPDLELAFPGDNSWSTMFRPLERGRQRHVTHRGIAEGTAMDTCGRKESVRQKRRVEVSRHG